MVEREFKLITGFYSEGDLVLQPLLNIIPQTSKRESPVPLYCST